MELGYREVVSIKRRNETVERSFADAKQVARPSLHSDAPDPRVPGSSLCWRRWP
jgi:hypothetical protein